MYIFPINSPIRKIKRRILLTKLQAPGIGNNFHSGVVYKSAYDFGKSGGFEVLLER
jgi:hypothetical protein